MPLIPPSTYKLCINCMTYNHAPYIEDSLKGFAIQKTEFPFAAFIYDDASTDNEQAIIKRYIENNIEKSSLQSEETNDAFIIAGIHKDNSNCHFVFVLLKYNFIKAKKAKTALVKGWYAGSIYRSMCEGDDYWTDPTKLQQQVDFLDSHPEYTMCFHDVDIKAEKGRTKYDVFGKLEDRDYTGFENLMKWSVPTCSIVYKNEISGLVPKNDKFRMGDNVLVLTCSKYGKIRCIPKKMGVYRLNPTSWIGGQSDKVQRYKYISHYTGLIEEFEECRDSRLYAILENQYFQLMTILKREGDKEEFNRVKDEYLNSPGEHHFERFNSYYRKMTIRRWVKKLLGRA